MQHHHPFIGNEERSLFERMATGDADAFSVLFHHYNKRIYPFVLGMIKSEQLAEEIVQDIFVQLWQKRQEALQWDRPQAYLYRMATNRTLDHLRKIARESRLIGPLDDTITSVVSTDDTEAWIDKKEAMLLIREAVSTLPPQRLKVYLFFREQGLSYREIAEQLGISVKTVQAHLQEANKQIRAYLSTRADDGLALILFVCMLKH